MAVFNNVLAGAAGSGGAAGYEIDRSLRFNSADSAYLNRTPSSAGNRKTWTWSGWVKRCADPSNHTALFTAGTTATDSGFFRITFHANGHINVATGATNILYDGGKLRDFSAWYHVLVSVDTTASSNQVKCYVNGALYQQATAISNVDTAINSTLAHQIGRDTGETTHADIYLADIHFIDGQALAPTDFGEYDDNNVWQPKAYSGTYGTNGFKLDFSDNTSTTTIAEDSSGNNNDWTANNLSVASGAGNDSLVDSPTNGDQTDTGVGNEVVGNYATLNPLDSATTLSNGNLTITGSGTAFKGVRSTIGMSSGKWYMECTMTAYSSSTSSAPGIWNGDDTSLNTGGGSYGNAYLFVTDYASNYRIYVNKGASNPYSEAGSISAGDIIGIALDLDNGECYVHINGTYLNSGSSVYSTWPADTYYFGGYEYTSGNQLDFNFGQRAFAYTAPSGFKALCTANLDDPTIADGSTAMDVVTYTGNGSTQTISGLNFSPDFIWTKSRSQVDSHGLHDTVRGRASNLYSDLTNGENISSASADLVSFDSNGYTLGTVEQTAMNRSGQTYVAWTWDGGTSTVSNTDGSITSSVRANASAGFSIVTWTAASNTVNSIGHGLNAAPEFIITKSRTANNNWRVYTAVTGKDQYLGLNSTSAAATFSNFWSTSEPTSSTFGVWNAAGAANNDGDMVAYCFAPVEGYSAIGSYTGNGSTDGPFVYTGFRPAFIIGKRYDGGSDNWFMNDSSRLGYNDENLRLYPNLSNAEGASSDVNMDILSNGFKLISTNTNSNGSGATYIYYAVAEHPFKTARAR